MAPARESARFAALRAALGGGPGDVRFVRAPGRVNLIGDHTDYQGGFCLPVAIDRDVLVAFRSRVDATVRVRSLDLDASVVLPSARSIPPWARPLVETLTLLSERVGARDAGFDAAITSTVPIGSGLSSSAAFEVALTIVAASVAGIELSGIEIAIAAQEIERRATGVPCGVMDQVASVAGRRDHALLLDCRALTVAPVPLPRAAAVLVVHSGLPRALATSAYAERRAACEASAARLHLASLRDATPEQVADDPFARHVVGENARVLAFADALRTGDLARAGELMVESHESLRDDFDVSTPELDLLVAASVDAGAFGARLTGAGFGGCIVALAELEGVEAVARSVTERYRSATALEPHAFTVRAVDGAGFVEAS
jgi:galactokinase